MNSPETILHHYAIGTIQHIRPITQGFINGTWRVTTNRGIFILQNVNAIYGASVMEDIDAVTQHLKTHGLPMSDIIRTTGNALFISDDTRFWRLYTCLPGVVHESVRDPHMAREAGMLLQTYHRVLNDHFDYTFKHARGEKNNIPLLYEAYKKAMAGNADPVIAAFAPILDRMLSHNLPDHLRKTVNHGDPKISNVIFTQEPSPKALAIIDLDDCNRGYNVLFELGSAFRSWCWAGAHTFSLEHFQGALEGYMAGVKPFLELIEIELIPRAIELNLLQLISRFVRDAIELRYFIWDQNRFPSLKEQNLARANEHLLLYNDIVAKRDAINEIIAPYLR